jgi:hypothetical protein
MHDITDECERLIATRHTTKTPIDDTISLNMVSSSLFDNAEGIISKAKSIIALDGKERKRMIRSKEIKEVPLWVCNYQNSIIDAEHIDIGEFGELQGKDWMFRNPSLSFNESIEYIACRRLEEQCGEGEYIVQPYNVSNGRRIPMEINGTYQRSGILDRRIQVINAISTTQHEWTQYVIDTLKSIYAYDRDTGSVILTRMNMIHDIMEWHEYLFHTHMDDEDTRQICDILSWNIYSMDSQHTGPIPVLSRWSNDDERFPIEDDITLYDFIMHE